MRVRRRLPVHAALMMALLGAVPGCSHSDSVLATVQVLNNTDDFLFVGQTFDRVATGQLHYTWGHSGSVADIIRVIAQSDGSVVSTNVTSGTATLSIKDAAGKQVYAGNLGSLATDTTATGMPGNWTVDMTFSATLGDIVLELKKDH